MREGYRGRSEGRHRIEGGEGREHRGDRGDRGGRGDRADRADQEGRHGRSGAHHGASGAQTFRRGRILAFLEQLQTRRATLARQLGEPEFEAIKPVISGELKALDHVIEDYIRLFDLQEVDSQPGDRRSVDVREEKH